MTILVLHVAGENVQQFLEQPSVYACYPLRPSTTHAIQGLSFERVILTAAANGVLNVPPNTDGLDKALANAIRATAQRCCASSFGSTTVEK